MVTSLTSEEFIGRFLVSYKDGETIYAFDEITHGLYKFSFELKTVSMVLSPESISHGADNKIMGISKSGDEIILIPYYLNSEWIFFDVIEEKIRYVVPLKDNICISGTITTGKKLILIPSHTYDPIIIYSLDGMNIIEVCEKWYKQTGDKINTKTPVRIWGASTCGDITVFPMINTRDIGCISGNNINVVTPDIPESIYSVSVYMNKIWILPISGEHIYESDFRGNIVNKVSLSQDGLKIRAKDFLRIAAAGETVFLFPVYGGNICAYQCRENQVVELKQQKKYLKGRLYEENLTPYWTYVVEDKILHLLPCDYHYKRINISSLDSEEYSLSYGKNINHTRYWEMMGNVQKECVFEKREGWLEDFLQYTLYLNKKNSTEENMENGKKIWQRIG